VTAPRLPARGRRAQGPASALAYNQPGGPLIAVCGLAGGAGTTTLAVAVARQAAADSTVPALLADASPERAGVAAAVGAVSDCCLLDLAAGRRPGRPFAEPAPRLRLVASAPKPAPQTTAGQLTDTLAGARAAHGLCVIDCATLASANEAILAAATDIVWVLPATAAAVKRAQILFASPLAPQRRGRELLAAVAVNDHAPAPTRALHALAAHRCDQLVLIGHHRGLADGDQAAAAAAYAPVLDCLAPGAR